MKTHPYHEEAQLLVKNYFKDELKIIQLLKKIEAEKIYDSLGYSSMFAYCTLCLKLSESQAGRFIGVSRKCVEIPALEMAIFSGELNPSRAKKILSVIEENPLEWIEKAKHLPTKELEKQVVAKNPEKAIQERLKPISRDRIELKCGISEALEKKLSRCKEIVGGNLELTLEALANYFLKSKDPIEKAERNVGKPKPVAKPMSRAIPAGVKHQVNVRDRGRCQFQRPDGSRCASTYFTEIHHVNPVSYGGKHEVNNLTTFCSSHHRYAHQSQSQELRIPLASKEAKRARQSPLFS